MQEGIPLPHTVSVFPTGSQLCRICALLKWVPELPRRCVLGALQLEEQHSWGLGPPVCTPVLVLDRQKGNRVPPAREPLAVLG